MTRRGSGNWWLPALLVLVAAGVSVAVGVRGIRSDTRLLDETGARGATVVDALVEYRDSTGDYPETLDELGVEIPAPVWGAREWRYTTYLTPRDSVDPALREGDSEFIPGFDLSVYSASGGLPRLYYKSPLGRWVLED